MIDRVEVPTRGKLVKRSWIVVPVTACLLFAAACSREKTATPQVSPTTLPAGAVAPGSAQYDRLCSPEPRQIDVQNIPGGPWKEVAASTFYIGEEANASNADITNVETQWYSDAVGHFGSGPDRWGPRDPSAPGAWDNRADWYPRDGLCPAGVTLYQNPFYVALPTPDYDENRRLTEAEPWIWASRDILPELKRFENGKFKDGESPFKDLWIQVEYGGRTAFGQLEDIGPADKTGAIVADYSYVWGDSPQPKNEFGMKAGIDLSPALTDYLGTNGEAMVRWRFVPTDQVPEAWKILVTAGPPVWD